MTAPSPLPRAAMTGKARDRPSFDATTPEPCTVMAPVARLFGSTIAQ